MKKVPNTSWNLLTSRKDEVVDHNYSDHIKIINFM